MTQNTNDQPRVDGQTVTPPERATAAGHEVIRTEHSPLPWQMKRAALPVDGEYDFAIYDEPHGVIAEVFGRSGTSVFPPAVANAAFIVRACNSHAELLAALKALLHEVSESGNAYARDFGWPRATDAARAAIAKAEGREA